jgi:acetolactate synthase-1/2/3 large subunit
VCWVESDPTEINNPRVSVDWAIQSDIATFCSSFLQVNNIRSRPVDHSWVESMISLKQQKIEDSPDLNSKQIQPRNLLFELSKLISDTPCTVVTGVGCHQHWAARHLPFHPQRCRLLTSGGHGTMGFDLPSAIGAAMAEPDRLVICVVGDGSFLMNIQEMAALRERNLNVKVLVMNNQRLGIVSQFQLLTWNDDPTTGSFGVPDFSLVSQGFGIPSQSLDTLDEVPRKLLWLITQLGPALLDAKINHRSDVVPMLLSGQTMGEMWMGR